MKPFEKKSSQIDKELEQDLPRKWKKIGDIIILDLSKIDKDCLLYTSPSPRD